MAKAHTYRLVVASVGESLFDGEVRAVTLPGSAGELTVLAHHEPFVTTLKPGALRIQAAEEGDNRTIDVPGGILEFACNRATVLL